MRHVSAVSLAPVHTRFGTTFARVVLSAVFAASGTALAQQCTPVTGNFNLTAPPDPGCGTGLLCLQGAFSGTLTGRSNSSLIGLQPVPNIKNAFIFTATSTLTRSDGKGSITTADVGVGTNCLNGPTSCMSSNEVLTITSGTGIYENAYGTIFLSGSYMAPPSVENPNPIGVYQGQICTGKPGRGGKDRG
ncbi:MAG: hypothetical protein JWN13_597 [Betaproteobacteria bacterium]|jgi:hypothetical protein|nr:hypothetical protein [Betaproteobacteria bacterium]